MESHCVVEDLTRKLKVRDTVRVQGYNGQNKNDGWLDDILSGRNGTSKDPMKKEAWPIQSGKKPSVAWI